jgi:hypothetical protein
VLAARATRNPKRSTQLSETRVLQPVENTQITGVYSKVWIFFQRPLRTLIVRRLMTSVTMRSFPCEKVGEPPRIPPAEMGEALRPK